MKTTCGHCVERDATTHYTRRDFVKVAVCAQCCADLEAADLGDSKARQRAMKAADGRGAANAPEMSLLARINSSVVNGYTSQQNRSDLIRNAAEARGLDMAKKTKEPTGSKTKTTAKKPATPAQQPLAFQPAATVTPSVPAPASPMLALVAPVLQESEPEITDAFRPSDAVKAAEQSSTGLRPVPVPLSLVAVRGTVKGGVACELAPRTLFIGRNGAHKTAVINTIELALRASASDVSWRADVKDESILMNLAPGRDGVLYAEVALSDGSRASYRTSNVKGEKHAVHIKPSVVDPARAFPLKAVREALSGSADTARRFFLERIVGGLKPSDVLSRIPADLHDLVKAAGFRVKDDAEGSTVVTALLATSVGAKKLQREANAEHKAHENVMTEAAAGLPPEPTHAEIEQAELAVAAATTALTCAAQASTLGDAPARLQEVLVEGQRITAEIIATQAKLAALPAASPIGAEYQLARDLLKWHVENHQDTCVTCGSGPQHGVTAAMLHQRFAAFETTIGSILANNAERTMAENGLRVLQNRLTTAQSSHDSLSQQISMAGQAVAGVTVTDAENNLNAAHEALAQLREIRAKHETRHKSQAALGTAHVEATRWKNVVIELKKLTKEFLDGSIDAFVNRVNRYLPEGDTFGLQLIDGEKEVFQVGLLRGKDLIVALSEVERIRISLAVAAALSENYTGLAVLIPEDRAFHPIDLGRAMDALAQSAQPVIMAHPVGPLDAQGRPYTPDGWTIIDCDKGEHAAKGSEWGFAPVVPSNTPVAQAGAAS